MSDFILIYYNVELIEHPIDSGSFWVIPIWWFCPKKNTVEREIVPSDNSPIAILWHSRPDPLLFHREMYLSYYLVVSHWDFNSTLILMWLHGPFESALSCCLLTPDSPFMKSEKSPHYTNERVLCYIWANLGVECRRLPQRVKSKCCLISPDAA